MGFLLCKKAENRTGRGNRGEILKVYRELNELSVKLLQLQVLLEPSVTNEAIHYALGRLVRDTERPAKSERASVLSTTIQRREPSRVDPVSHTLSPGIDLQNIRNPYV